MLSISKSKYHLTLQPILFKKQNRFGTVLKSYSNKIVIMEMRREGEKRRRKMIVRPVLVRSVKPGQALSATYERETAAATTIWKN